MGKKYSKKIEVKSNGIVIRYTNSVGSRIEFLDNEEAKKVLSKINNQSPKEVSASYRNFDFIEK